MTPSNNIAIPGYNEFIFEPTESTHGGTGFFIKDNLDFCIRNDLKLVPPSESDSADFESMFVEIVFPDRKNMIIGCVYRHPSSNISVTDFTEKHLEPILHKISREKKECTLMGDFNVDLLKSSGNNAASDFFNNLSSHFFTPFILQPTRLKAKTLIDNILVNTLEYQSNSGNLLLEISDHLIQFVIFEGFTKERSVSDTKLYKRDFSRFNEREFEEVVINGTNWDEICMLDSMTN